MSDWQEVEFEIDDIEGSSDEHPLARGKGRIRIISEPDPEPDPQPSGRLLAEDLEYRGAFGVEEHANWNYGNGLAYCRQHESLFLGAHWRTGAVGEVGLHIDPDVIDDPAGLLKVPMLTPPTVDLWDPERYAQIPPASPDGHTNAEKNHFRHGDLHVLGDKLYASFFRFYNQEEFPYDFLYWSSLDVHDQSKANGIGGVEQKWDTALFPGDRPKHSDKMNGVMFGVPDSWARAALGMTNAIGVGRSKSSGSKGASAGPTAYFLEPETGELAAEQPDTHQRYLVDVKPGMYFPMAASDKHPIEGHEQADSWDGAAIVTASNGNRALVYVCVKGLSKAWYGTTHAGGNKGWQGWPFQSRLAFFDLDQIAEVITGKRLPWDIAPYAWAGLEMPGEALPDHPIVHPVAEKPWGDVLFPLGYPYATQALPGLAYDPEGNRLWMIQRSVIPGPSPQPVIHEWKVR